RGTDLGRREGLVGERRERHRTATRLLGQRQRPPLVHADRERRRPGRLERVVPDLFERRRGVVRTGEAQRCRGRVGRVRQRRWFVPGGVRRLRRDGGEGGGEEVRGLGRRVQLDRAGRHLVQPA